MNVVYTDEAIKDLAAIADWLAVRYPAVDAGCRAAHTARRRSYRAVAGQFAPDPEPAGRSHGAARTLSLQNLL
jgi:plasmid stabilization system protein ParE